MSPKVAAALVKYRETLPKSEAEALAAWASTFWAFQRGWLFEDADLAICNKSRQIGFSHTTAGVAVRWGAFHGELTTVISEGKVEAKEVLDKSRRHAAVLQSLGSEMARTTRSNSNEIVFASGGRIIALPSTGGRGFSGNVFLDEFSYQEHADEVWENTAPVTLLGGKMRVSSTPNGVGNEFHGLWDIARNGGQSRSSKPSRWVPYEVPLEVAITEGYPVDMDKCWDLAKGDPRLFAQMFQCSFLDNEFQYVPTADIDACCTTEPTPPVDPTAEYFAGLDIGREADLTVLLVVRLERGVRRVVHVETMKRTDSDGLEAMVARAFDTYKLKRLCIDSTGLGTFPAERIKNRHSEKADVAYRRPRVEPVPFTPNSKEKLATGMYAAFTSRNVLIPANDAALRKDIAAIRRMVSASGNVIYDAPRTSEGHADRAWALALALHACGGGGNPLVAALLGKR